MPNVGVLQPTEGSCADHSRAPCRSTSDPIRLLPRCVTHSGQALGPPVSARDFGMTQLNLLMLTTEALVSELPEKKEAPAMPGGHGGMGDMGY
jgi:hypothetical protein